MSTRSVQERLQESAERYTHGMPHFHLHQCEVCFAEALFRRPGEKGALKMCPCAEAFYCRKEHQREHWSKVHKYTCYAKKNKEKLSGKEEVAAKFLLQAFDYHLVDVVVNAHLRDDVNADLAWALWINAVEIHVETRHDLDMISSTMGKIPPFKVSTLKKPRVLVLADEARQRGLRFPFFEDPSERLRYTTAGQLSISIILQPTGRLITKHVSRDFLAYLEDRRHGLDHIPPELGPGDRVQQLTWVLNTMILLDLHKRDSAEKGGDEVEASTHVVTSGTSRTDVQTAGAVEGGNKRWFMWSQGLREDGEPLV